jgi:formylglycine-generating enzyme required for sulfatase activity
MPVRKRCRKLSLHINGMQILLLETVMSFRADKEIRIFPGIFITIVAAGMIVYSGSAKSQAAGSFRDCRDCPEMVEIPKGSFLMGSDTGRDDEKPMHRVTIGSSFAVGKYEVTRRQYQIFSKDSNFSKSNGCEVYDVPSFNMNFAKSWTDPDFKQNGNHPVVCVNWHDAQAYVGWLSAKTGKKYRLLSESEWEYAARAGSVAKYAFGDTIDSTKANYGDQFRRTSSVGSYPGNKFGLHDMHGNAAEWVTDCWVENYEHTPVTGGPMTKGPCQNRVIRGGTWHNQAQYLRSAFRNGYFADFRLSGIGFRVAREL